MIFHPDLAEKILSGEKTVTRRPFGRRSYEVGQTWAVQTGRGHNGIGRIKLIEVQPQLLLDILEIPGDAVKEGFPAVWDFFKRWEEIYGAVDMFEHVWRLEFELADAEVRVEKELV